MKNEASGLPKWTPELLSPATPKGFRAYFYIPLYQRLFAWSEVQIRALLKDLLDAFKNPEKSGNHYFIGTLVLAPREQPEKSFDVVDGQQRLTALWLIGLVLANLDRNEQDGNTRGDWKKFLFPDAGPETPMENWQPRIAFVGRDADEKYLRNLAAFLGDKEDTVPNLRGISIPEGANPKLKGAVDCISSFFSEGDFVGLGGHGHHYIREFSRFVFKCTSWFHFELPPETDLNKYFEVMNDRGLQLEKHQILKANLLELISDDERKWFSVLWDACSQMDSWIDRASDNAHKDAVAAKVKGILQRDRASGQEVTRTEIGQTGGIGLRVFLQKEEEKRDCAQTSTSAGKTEPRDSEVETRGTARSMLSFSEFIMHSFKLFLHSEDPGGSWKINLNDGALLETVVIKDGGTAKRFIEFLFKSRVLFDQYFIKGFVKDPQEGWEVQPLRPSEDGNRRDQDEATGSRRVSEEWKVVSQVQSFLRVSTEPEHWVTPALQYVLSNHESDKGVCSGDFLNWLERLDHLLACRRLQRSPGLLIDTAHNAIQSLELQLTQADRESYEKFHSQPDEILNKGTQTPRYWFFKLDYCLWKKTDPHDFTDIRNFESLWKNFRFRGSTSVEHIFPRSKSVGDWKGCLDSFGNLALISVSSNSSYSDQFPGPKKEDFIRNANKTHHLESLKLARAFQTINGESPGWTIEACEMHGKEMIEILKEWGDHISTSSHLAANTGGG